MGSQHSQGAGCCHLQGSLQSPSQPLAPSSSGVVLADGRMVGPEPWTFQVSLTDQQIQP